MRTHLLAIAVGVLSACSGKITLGAGGAAASSGVAGGGGTSAVGGGAPSTSVASSQTGASTSTSTGSSASAGPSCPGSIACATASDCPPAAGPCIVASCAGGCCGTSYAVKGTWCAGGTLCDGLGACVGCNIHDDCEALAPVGPCIFNAYCGVGGDQRCYLWYVGLHPCSGDALGCCDGHACSDLLHDVKNCGACGQVCPQVLHATVGCAGACYVASCDSLSPGVGPYWADCDGLYDNGCESNPWWDSNNCGSCGNVCPTGQSCACGVCHPACPAPFESCNCNPVDVCETDLSTDPNNCGSCRVRCAPGQSCVLGVCQ